MGNTPRIHTDASAKSEDRFGHCLLLDPSFGVTDGAEEIGADFAGRHGEEHRYFKRTKSAALTISHPAYACDDLFYSLSIRGAEALTRPVELAGRNAVGGSAE